MDGWWVDGWMDGWLNGWWVDGWTGGRVDGWIDEWMDGWMDGWKAWMDGMDGWMVAWMVGLLVGWFGACGWHVAQVRVCRARVIRNVLGKAANVGDARDAGDTQNTGAFESVGDAGSAAGLLHTCSVWSLPPTRAPMAARAVMMHQRRWASKRCERSATATVSRKAKLGMRPFGRYMTPDCCQPQPCEVQLEWLGWLGGPQRRLVPGLAQLSWSQACA